MQDKMRLVSPHAFWDEQPVFHLIEDEAPVRDCAIKNTDISKISKEELKLPAGFEWVTLDLTSDEDAQKVVDLLNDHYQSRETIKFKKQFSMEFLRW